MSLILFDVVVFPFLMKGIAMLYCVSICIHWLCIDVLSIDVL